MAQTPFLDNQNFALFTSVLLYEVIDSQVDMYILLLRIKVLREGSSIIEVIFTHFKERYFIKLLLDSHFDVCNGLYFAISSTMNLNMEYQ